MMFGAIRGVSTKTVGTESGKGSILFSDPYSTVNRVARSVCSLPPPTRTAHAPRPARTRRDLYRSTSHAAQRSFLAAGRCKRPHTTQDGTPKAVSTTSRPCVSQHVPFGL